MNLRQPSPDHACHRQGSALLILLILLSIAIVLTVCNQMTLRRLMGELNLLEKRQQQRYSQPTITNSVASLRSDSTNVVANPAGDSPAADFNPSSGRPAR